MTSFDRVAIYEAPWNRVQSFRLQARNEADAEWQTFLEGTTLGDFRRRVEPVAARYVRLDILEADDVPTIWEIQLFEPNGAGTVKTDN